jgi:NADH:ubiquinone oxidoreductase subunit E
MSAVRQLRRQGAGDCSKASTRGTRSTNSSRASRSGKQRSAVLSALRFAQEQNNGFLTSDLMDAVAEYLRLPPIQVYEVASFYSMFETHPCGRHHVSICTNISCMLNGAENIVATPRRNSASRSGESTPDLAHLPQEGGRVPRGLHGRADDDGRPRLPRVPHAFEGRQDPRQAEVTRMGTWDDK